MQRLLPSIVLLLALLLCSARGLAFESLLQRLPNNGRLSALFLNDEARAVVRDGPLLGQGSEHTEVLPGGVLRVLRSRTYTRAVDPKSGKLVTLPEPWHVRSTITLSPGLRLLGVETTLDLHRSIDRAMGYPWTEKVAELFSWDRALVRSSPDGKRLTRSLFLHDRATAQMSYDYREDAIPLDIVALVLSVAVSNHVDRFDFQLLLPDGATHGVRSVVHRTRDPRPFERGYRLPAAGVPTGADLAMVDLSLASPIKHLFYPHHFYFVYGTDQPTKLLALWGGDPDEPLMAFRVP